MNISYINFSPWQPIKSSKTSVSIQMSGYNRASRWVVPYLYGGYIHSNNWIAWFPLNLYQNNLLSKLSYYKFSSTQTASELDNYNSIKAIISFNLDTDLIKSKTLSNLDGLYEPFIWRVTQENDLPILWLIIESGWIGEYQSLNYNKFNFKSPVIGSRFILTTVTSPIPVSDYRPCFLLLPPLIQYKIYN